MATNHDEEPVRVLRVLDKALTCCHCGQPLDADDEVRWVNADEARHTAACPAWGPAGPISDGTLRCPHGRGALPCQKRIPAGWHENEGHPGGHWFESDAHADARRAGTIHIDARALLALQPAAEHPADQCPDPRTCPGAW